MSLQFKLMVATLVTIVVTIFIQNPVAAQCPIGQELVGSVCSTFAPVGEGNLPFGVQGVGEALNDANLYTRLHELPRWHDQAANATYVLTTVPKGTTVRYGQKDVRFGFDACMVYYDPYYGWGACWDFTNSLALQEIPKGGEMYGGYLQQAEVQAQPSYQPPATMPDTGGSSGACISDAGAGTWIGGNCVVWSK